MDWKSLNQRYNTNKSIFLQRIRNEKVPSSISNMFKIQSNDRYNLRSNNNIYDFGKPKTNYMKKSFSYSAASLWNGVSNEAKESGISIKKFKRILDDT